MHPEPRPIDVRIVLVVTIGYVIVGTATAALAGGATTARGTTIWRLAAWMLSLAIFAFHVAISRRGRSVSVVTGALNVALAVALAAFALAALGPVRSHWRDAHMARVAVLSLVAWPVLTGLPAFIAALLGGHILERRFRSKHAPPSRVA